MKKSCKTYRRKISETVKYDELDMENLSRSTTSRMSEDDGPHTSKLTGDENKHFTTVADPTSVINQPTSLGNVDGKFNLASRQTGKPFKALRKQMKYSGGEDFTGAVAKVGIGEGVVSTIAKKALGVALNPYVAAALSIPDAWRAGVWARKKVESGLKGLAYNFGPLAKAPITGIQTRPVPMRYPVNEAKDKGEYDYEGDMAKSQLRSIIYNARMLHDMLKDDTNLPEWVQSKITLAEDYVVTAAQYMNSSVKEEVEQVNELEDKTMQSALLKRAQRLVDAERDTTLSPQNKKIVTAFHRQRMAKIARHIQTHKYPAMRELMKKYDRRNMSEAAMPAKMKYAQKAASAAPNKGVSWQAKYTKGVKFAEKSKDIPDQDRVFTFRRKRSV